MQCAVDFDEDLVEVPLVTWLGSSVPQRDILRYIALWQAKRLPVDALRTSVLPLTDINKAFETLATGEAIRQILIPSA